MSNLMTPFFQSQHPTHPTHPTRTRPTDPPHSPLHTTHPSRQARRSPLSKSEGQDSGAVRFCPCGRRILDIEDEHCGVVCARRDALSSLCANEMRGNTRGVREKSEGTLNGDGRGRRVLEFDVGRRAGREHVAGLLRGGVGEEDPFRDAPDDRSGGGGTEDVVMRGSHSGGSSVSSNVSTYASIRAAAGGGSGGGSSRTYPHSRGPSSGSSISSHPMNQVPRGGRIQAHSHSRNPSYATRPPSLSSSVTSLSSSSSSSFLPSVFTAFATGDLSRNPSNASAASSSRSARGPGARGLNVAIYEDAAEGEGGVEVLNGMGGWLGGDEGRADGKPPGLMLPVQLYGEAGWKESSVGPLRVGRHGNVQTGPGYSTRRGNVDGDLATTSSRRKGKKIATSPGAVVRGGRDARSGSVPTGDEPAAEGRRRRARGTSRTTGVPLTPFTGMRVDLADVLEDIISMERGFRIDSSEEENSGDTRVGTGMDDDDVWSGRREGSTGPSAHQPLKKSSLQSLASRMSSRKTTGESISSGCDGMSGPPRTPPLALERGRRLSLIAPSAPVRVGRHSASNSIHVAPPPGASPTMPESFAHVRPLSFIPGHVPTRSESYTSLQAAIEGPGPNAVYDHARRLSEASARSRPDSGSIHNAEYSPGSAYYMAVPARNASQNRRSLSFAVDPPSGIPGFAFETADGCREERFLAAGIDAPSRMDCSTPTAQTTGGRSNKLLSFAGDGLSPIGQRDRSSPTCARRQFGTDRESMRRFQFPLSNRSSSQVTPVKARPQLLFIPVSGTPTDDVVTPTGSSWDPIGLELRANFGQSTASSEPSASIQASLTSLQPMGSSTMFPSDVTPDLPHVHPRVAPTHGRAPSSGVRLGALLGSGGGSQTVQLGALAVPEHTELDFEMTDESDGEADMDLRPLRWASTEC